MLHHLLRSLLVLVTVVGVVACSSAEERADQHFERAMEHVEAGNDAKAMVEFRNVLDLEPKNAEAIYQVGRIHMRAQRWPEAMASFRAAAAERPGYVDANMARGELALLAGDADAAAGAADAILAEYPASPEGRVLQAAVDLRRDQPEDALAAAEAVLAEAPENRRAIAVAVGALQAMGRSDAAGSRLDTALARFDEAVDLRLLRIALYEQAGDVDGARRMYREIVELRPDDIRNRLAFAEFLAGNEDMAGAESVLREAAQTIDDGGDLATALVGLVFRERGADAAEAELRRLIEEEPDNARFRFLLADLMTRQNRLDEAEAALTGILDADFEEAMANDAKAALARLRLAQNDVEGAKPLLEEVLASDGGHRGANLVQGMIHLAENDADAAFRSARTALRSNDEWAPALKLLAEAQLRRGEIELAVSTLQDVVELAPNDAAAAELLATLHTRRGDLNAALDLWDRLVRVEDRRAQALAARAQIRIAQENWNGAEADIAALAEFPEQETRAALLAGRLELSRERYPESRESFRRVLADAPGTNTAVAGIVDAYLAEDEMDAAVAFLEERTRARPEDAVAHRMKANILARRGDTDAAIAALDETIALQPRWRVPYVELAAIKREVQGDPSGAVAVFERALEAMPDDPAMLEGLGESQLVAGHMQAAIATYDRLLELQPDNDRAANNFAALVADHAYDDPDRLADALAVAQRFRGSDNGLFLDTLGWLHYRNGDYPVASTYLGRAVAQVNDRPDLRYHLGMALKANGDVERAREELRRALDTDVEFAGRAEAVEALATLDAEAEASEAEAAATAGG